MLLVSSRLTKHFLPGMLKLLNPLPPALSLVEIANKAQSVLL